MSTSEVILAQRTIAAPVEDVWQAWADPIKLAEWWRTSAIKQTVITEYDFRLGGVWRQHAIDQDDFEVGLIASYN